MIVVFQWHRQGTVDLAEEVRRLQEQTMPPGTSMPARADLVSGESVARAEWMFTTSLTSRQYFEWLKDHLPENYAVVNDTPAEMTLGRQLPGDAFTLTLSASDAEPKQIRAKFSAGPD